MASAGTGDRTEKSPSSCEDQCRKYLFLKQGIMTVKHAEKPLNSVSASKEGVVHITENILLCTTPSFEALTLEYFDDLLICVM